MLYIQQDHYGIGPQPHIAPNILTSCVFYIYNWTIGIIMGLEYRSIAEDNTKYPDFFCDLNLVNTFCSGFVFLPVKLDFVASFKVLASNERKPTLCENWFRVSPFLANGALEGPNMALIINCLKIYSMTTFERWERLEILGRHWESLVNIRRSEYLWEACHL